MKELRYVTATNCFLQNFLKELHYSHIFQWAFRMQYYISLDWAYHISRYHPFIELLLSQKAQFNGCFF